MWKHLHYFINWAQLSHASLLLLWLSIGAGALYVILMALLNIIAIWKLPNASPSFPGTSRAYANAQKGKRLVNEWAPRVALFIVGYVLGSASIFSPIRELHNVEVLSRDSDRVYTVRFPEYGVMTIRLCANGDDLPLIPGMVITQFQYKQMRDCILIDQDTFDDWKRDSSNNVVDKNGKILFAKEN